LRSRIPATIGRAIGVGHRGDQRVQGLLPFQPADRGALLGVAVHLAVGGVQVDEHHLLGAGQQVDPLCELDQALAEHRIQLLHVPVGERPQERAQRRGSPHLVEQQAVPRVPQPVDVLDRVRSGDHPSQQRHHLRRRVGARTVRGVHDRQMIDDQLRQADLLSQRDHRNQSRVGHQTRVVERDINRRRRIR
jgi:hypothetical protein